MEITDTDRLNFLLEYFSIDDIGDEEVVKGVCVRCEALESVLTWTHDGKNQVNNWEEDMRAVIDKSILD